MADEDKGGSIPGPEGDAPEGGWQSEALEKFVRGDITLAELEGVDGESQSKIAHLGHRMLTSGKLDDAKLLFEGLVALNPYEPYFLLAAGSVAQQQDRFDDAERWYTRALERDPEHVVARANRGEVRAMRGDVAGATEDLVAAVKLDPKAQEPTTARARGLLVEIKKQLDEAQKGGAKGASARPSRLKPPVTGK